MSIREEDTYILKPSVFEALEEICPCLFGLIGIDSESDDLPATLAVHSIGDHERLGYDPVIFPDLEVRCVYGHKRIVVCQRSVFELVYCHIKILT